MSALATAIVLLAVAGVVCAVFNIAYNPEEYEYTDYRQNYRMDCRQDYRKDEPKGERHD